MVIVLVDDEVSITRLYERVLSGYQVHSFNDPLQVLHFAGTHRFDLIITDQKMPGISGIELIRTLGAPERSADQAFMSLVVSAYTDADDLIDAVNSGLIYRYLVKPIHPNELLQTVYQIGELIQTRRERDRLSRELEIRNRELELENIALKTERKSEASALDRFIGFHPETIRLKDRVKMFADSDNPVLITGETGTGKELVARAIHACSQRADKPFVALNCSAFSPHLLESELFGHTRGAYTGASAIKKGLLETAENGTLFLDELGDFPPEQQAKILRFIQFGTFIPVGSTSEKSTDVRIVSATNSNIPEKVRLNQFRQDLYYRINTLSIHIPPLRARKVDIIPIMEAIAFRRGFRIPPFGEGVREMILGHPFHGNVRELEAFVEKMFLLDRQQTIEILDGALVRELLLEDAYAYSFPEGSKQEMTTASAGFPGAVPEGSSLPVLIEQIESDVISSSLERCAWNISRTARILGLSRQGLKNKLKRYGINER